MYVTVEYRDAKRDPDNYVCICVDIPKLKKKLFGGGAANADIMLELAERYIYKSSVTHGGASLKLQFS